MIFLNFLRLPESVFHLNFLGKYFLGNQVNFLLTGKYFPLINFFNDKQIQVGLESGFLETTFQEKKQNMALNK